MKITILTLFPELFEGFANNSIIKRAIAKGVCELEFKNIRDYTKDKYGRVDTPPIGGGAGLVMKCQPVVDAIKDNKTAESKVILMSPRGQTYNQKKAHQLANEYKHIILVCGHYEGLDERINNYIDETISIGDFILTGGEIASMAIADSIIRLLDGAIKNDSIKEESFENNLLEYPQYTKPPVWHGMEVPEVLTSGHHANIKKWQRERSIERTLERRPELLENAELSRKEKEFLEGKLFNLNNKSE